MPESKRRAGDVAVKPRGSQALLGAAIAMVGALATVHPTNALLAALLFWDAWAGSSDPI